MVVGYAFNKINGAFMGAIFYVALSQTLRRVVPRHHRKAIAYCKRKEYDRAIPEFQKSTKFFSDNQWIDEFRAITMLSEAGMLYREMGLISLGFCYAQIGDGENARLTYEQCLKEFPDSEMAKSALRLINAGARCRSDPT